MWEVMAIVAAVLTILLLLVLRAVMAQLSRVADALEIGIRIDREMRRDARVKAMIMHIG